MMKRPLCLFTILLISTSLIVPMMSASASEGAEPFSYRDQLDENGKVIYDMILDAKTDVLLIELPIALEATGNEPGAAQKYLEDMFDQIILDVEVALRMSEPYAYWVWTGNDIDITYDFKTVGNRASISSVGLEIELAEWYSTDPKTGERIGVQPFIDELKEAVDKFSTDSTSVRDKVMDINNYITNLVTYEPNLGDAEKESKYMHDAYGALVSADHYAVCDGYSSAFMLLCEKEGITCFMAQGSALPSGEPHAWNYVLMDDNKWYGMDVTWNDGTDNQYFLLGLESFSPRHQQGAYLQHGLVAYPFHGPPLSQNNYDDAGSVIPQEYSMILAIAIVIIIAIMLIRSARGKT